MEFTPEEWMLITSCLKQTAYDRRERAKFCDADTAEILSALADKGEALAEKIRLHRASN